MHHSLGGRFALRYGRWKAIFAPGSGGGFSEPSISNLFASGSGRAHTNPVWDKDNPRGQLYDIENDPFERHDLWDEQPAVVLDLYARLREICVDETSGLPFGVPISGNSGLVESP
ncbi:MAG TPA: hypothetical protein VF062_07335 [Candidatus Limnocylindrales bacterium]